MVAVWQCGLELTVCTEWAPLQYWGCREAYTAHAERPHGTPSAYLLHSHAEQGPLADIAVGVDPTRGASRTTKTIGS